MQWSLHLHGLSLLVSLAHAAKNGLEANPVQGVTKLLESLQKQIQSEGKAEAAAYDKFACFCKEQADEKLYSITKKTARIDELAASIKKLTAGIDEFTATMEAGKKKKAELESESKAAIAQRGKDYADFVVLK